MYAVQFNGLMQVAVNYKYIEKICKNITYLNEIINT